MKWTPDTEVCRCGRRTVPTHCVGCGSTYLYVRISESQKITIPAQRDQPKDSPFSREQTQVIQRFVCRRCGDSFFENENCRAPEKIKTASRLEIQAPRRQMRKGKPENTPTGDVQKELLRHLASQFPDNAKLKEMLASTSPLSESGHTEDRNDSLESSPVDNPPPEWF